MNLIGKRVVVMRTGLALAMASCLVVMLLGVIVAVDDLATRGEMWDGLGLFLGLLAAGAALVTGVVALLGYVWARRRPTPARVLAGVVALVGCGLAYPYSVDTSWGWLLWPLPLALLAAAVAPDRKARGPRNEYLHGSAGGGPAGTRRS